MKRYAIVRVEHYCPIVEDNNGDLKQTPYCPQDKDKNFLCSDCKMLKNYGDTKEQLVRKVAQVIKRESLKGAIWESDLAKEIVEFLGVE
jgi:hypothetical protein